MELKRTNEIAKLIGKSQNQTRHLLAKSGANPACLREWQKGKVAKYYDFDEVQKCLKKIA